MLLASDHKSNLILLRLLSYLLLQDQRVLSGRIQLFLNQTHSGLQDLLQLEGQSPLDVGQCQAHTDFLAQQLLHQFVHIRQLIATNTRPQPQLPIIGIEGFQKLIDFRCLEGQSQIDQSHGCKIFIIPLSQIEFPDIPLYVHLQHFHNQAQKLGRFFSSPIKHANTFDFDCLINEGDSCECKTLLLPVSTVEYSVAGGLIDQLGLVLLSHFDSFNIDCGIWFSNHQIGSMGYQREKERDRSRHSRDYDREKHHRRRSDSPSDSERRRDSHRDGHRHNHDRDYEYSRSRDDRHHSRRSRSRSPDFRNDQEWKQEECDQKIRLAIRNSTINYDMSIHEMYSKLPEAKREQLAEQAVSPQHIGQCILVRELYVSGMYDSNQTSIRQFFSRYGEVESVEIIKNFIFVKYFKVEDASNACADYHNINTTLHHNTHNSNFKIFFADHLKRFNVVSNNPTYELNEYLIPVVYASVRNDPQYANQQYLNGIFSRFGFIRNMEIKRNQLPTQRTYVLVEYETIEQALRAREKMKVQRDKLGDRKSEITLLIDNQKITKKYPNINNQIRYQIRRNANTQKPTQATSQAAPTTQQFNQPSYQAPPQAFNQQRQQFNVNDFMDIINKHAGNMDVEEEHHLADWSGFFTKNRKHKVGVDFVRIHKEPLELDHISLNINFRADLREALDSNSYNLAGKFKASQSSDLEIFRKNYIDYFAKKKRAGILMTNKYLIYLIPPLPQLNIQYPVRPDQLLALFFNLE